MTSDGDDVDDLGRTGREHAGDPDDGHTTERDPRGPDAFETGPTAHVGTGTSRPAPLVPGMELNATYRLEARLGEGGMGEVWRARHLRLPKSVAIKVLLPGVDASGEALERFVREAEIGATLAHPNIVHVFDFNTLEDGRRYLAMELLEGESLAERLERGPLTAEETSEVLRQTAVGLRVAHEAGVVHRDLKPDNLFLVADPGSDPPWRVKILDFGISKIQRADATLTRDMTVMGTPAYMAPEQAMGHTRRLGPEADQFALATIAYEMLTGEVAFRGNTLAEIVYRVVQETPPAVDTLRPDVPARCARAIERAMAKDPSGRFPDVATFVDAFVGTAGAVDREARAQGAPAPDVAARTVGAMAVGNDGRAPAATSDAPSGRPAAPSAAPGGSRRPGWVVWAAAALAVGGAAAAVGAMVTARDRAAAGPGTTGEAPGVIAVDREPEGDDGRDTAGGGATGGGSTGGGVAGGGVAGGDVVGTDPAGGGAAASPGDAPVEDGDGDDAQRPGDAEDGATARADDTTSGDAASADGQSGNGRARLAPGTRALLDDARVALAAGDGRQALRLAERAYRGERNGEALELMARAACVERDLGLANARLARLPRGARRRVARWCRSQGLNVAP